MTEVEQIEAAVGSKIEQWNAESFAETISLKENEHLLDYFQDSNVVKEIYERSRDNPEIFSIFEPLYYKVMQQDALQKINDILIQYSDAENNISADPKLLDSLIDCQKNSTNFYEKTYIYVAIAAVFPDYDLSQFYEDIHTSVNKTANIVPALISNLSNYYDFFKDTVSAIETLRTQYFAKYNVDILDENKEYDESIEIFTSIEADLLRFAKEEALEAEAQEQTKKEADEKSDEEKKDDSEDN